MRTLEPVGIARGRRHHREGIVASDGGEPGSDRVTAFTRAFEEIDAQVFAGPGRGATRSEAAASDRWGGASPATAEAYRRMFDLVVKRRLTHPRMSERNYLSNTAVAPNAPTADATSHQNEPPRREDRRV